MPTDPAAAQIQCPHCGQPYTVTPEQAAQAAGQTITCQNCQRPFAMGSPGAPPPVARGFVPPTTPPVGPMSYGRPARSNPLATASLACGVLFFVMFLITFLGGIAIGATRARGVGIFVAIPSMLAPLFALLAVIFGIIGLVKSRDPEVPGRGYAIAGLCMGGTSILLAGCMISILLPSLNRARETANRVKCASNMRQIGQAILLYSNDNRGRYPDRLEDLILTQPIGSDEFVCPTTNDSAAPGADPKTQAKNLSAGGHLSYVYVGKGMTNAATPETVVLYEPLSSHSDGMNALFGDGHVEFFNKQQAQKIITAVQSGQNPPAGGL